MRKVTIDIQPSFLMIKPEGKSIRRDSLKELNKYLFEIAGPKTADVVVRFMQVWNEKERVAVSSERDDVSEWTRNQLVSGNQQPEVATRKRRRRRRSVNKRNGVECS